SNKVGSFWRGCSLRTNHPNRLGGPKSNLLEVRRSSSQLPIQFTQQRSRVTPGERMHEPPAAALLPERLGVDVLRADPRVADHHVAYGPQPPHLVIAEVRPRLLLPQQPRLEALLHRLAVGPELLVHPQLVADQGDQIRNAGLPARLLHRSAQVLVVGPQQLRCPSVLRALDLPGEL